MIESNVMDTLRDEVKSELINQAGRYNPNNRDVNVRIVEDIRVAIDADMPPGTPSNQIAHYVGTAGSLEEVNKWGEASYTSFNHN